FASITRRSALSTGRMVSGSNEALSARQPILLPHSGPVRPYRTCVPCSDSGGGKPSGDGGSRNDGSASSSEDVGETTRHGASASVAGNERNRSGYARFVRQIPWFVHPPIPNLKQIAQISAAPPGWKRAGVALPDGVRS